MNDFFAPVYEFFYYTSPFSDDIYNEDLYFGLGLMAIMSSLAVCFIYYYVVNHPRWSKWYHWLLFLMISTIINYLFAIVYSKNVFETLGYTYSSEYFLFGFAQAIISSIFFILFTYTIRWWSRNCSTTPIPQ